MGKKVNTPRDQHGMLGIQYQHLQNMNKIEIRMLRWICIKDKITSETRLSIANNIRNKILISKWTCGNSGQNGRNL